MRVRVRNTLLPAAAFILVSVLLLGIGITDRHAGRTDEVPRMDVQFFRSADGYFVLFVCGGEVAVVCPGDAAGAEALTASLKSRRAAEIDFLILTDGETEDEIKGALGEFSVKSVIAPTEGEDRATEFAVGAAKLTVTRGGGAVFLCAEHAGKTAAFCFGDVDAGAIGRFADGADIVGGPSSATRDEEVRDCIERSDVSRIVIFDTRTDPADGEFLDILRKNGVKYIRTAYGNVSVRCGEDGVYLLPDAKGAE